MFIFRQKWYLNKENSTVKINGFSAAVLLTFNTINLIFMGQKTISPPNSEVNGSMPIIKPVKTDHPHQAEVSAYVGDGGFPSCAENCQDVAMKGRFLGDKLNEEVI